MSKIRTLTKRRAVSPVIATVILVAVTITVAVAVSYWMSNITGQYTAFEKIEIVSGYATKTIAGNEVPGVWDATGEVWTTVPIPETVLGWRITITLKNTGSAPSTITSFFVNEKPMEEYAGAITCEYIEPAVLNPVDLSVTSVTLESGITTTLYINIVQAEVTFSSGTTINIKLHSAGGMDYIRLIRLS